jgi:hypothetical protein
MRAPRASDLHEIARPEILDPSRIEGDIARNEVLEWLLAMPKTGAPPELAALFSRLNAKSSTARIHVLATEWHGNAKLGRPGHQWRLKEPQAIETWRRLGKRRWEVQEHTRDNAIGHRTDIYRKAARALVESADTIILEEFDLAKAAKLENRADQENPTARHGSAQPPNRGTP